MRMLARFIGFIFATGAILFLIAAVGVAVVVVSGARGLIRLAHLDLPPPDRVVPRAGQQAAPGRPAQRRDALRVPAVGDRQERVRGRHSGGRGRRTAGHRGGILRRRSG